MNNKYKNEREIAIDLLKESTRIANSIQSFRDDLHDEEIDEIVKSLSIIDKKAMSLFICDNDNARDQFMPEALRQRFYEESADELFKLDRFFNLLNGKDNAVV